MFVFIWNKIRECGHNKSMLIKEATNQNEVSGKNQSKNVLKTNLIL